MLITRPNRIPALWIGTILAICGSAPSLMGVEPSPKASAAFDAYVESVEARLAQQHRSPNGFLAPEDADRLRRGELIIERLSPREDDTPGAMIHHWRGTAFAPGAKAADFGQLMRDVDAYPQRFAPQVVQARLLSSDGGHRQVLMRVRQKHILTVVLDTTYDITFGRLDPQHGYSISRSIRISEIESPGTEKERALSPTEGHGFLWRLNTYWSYEERDGGLLMQIESISLTRSIPTGLGWAIGPFVEGVPRESLEFTLRSVRNALRAASSSEPAADSAERKREP